MRSSLERPGIRISVNTTSGSFSHRNSKTSSGSANWPIMEKSLLPQSMISARPCSAHGSSSNDYNRIYIYAVILSCLPQINPCQSMTKHQEVSLLMFCLPPLSIETPACLTEGIPFHMDLVIKPNVVGQFHHHMQVTGGIDCIIFFKKQHFILYFRLFLLSSRWGTARTKHCGAASGKFRLRPAPIHPSP